MHEHEEIEEPNRRKPKPETSAKPKPAAGNKTTAAAAESLRRRHAGGDALPERLLGGLAALSGISLADVRVRRGSDKPKEINARAFATGDEIHLAPGQDHHLPHEAWHLVQQRQGRVRPTRTVAGVAVNDDAALEREASVRGKEAAGFTGGDMDGAEVRASGTVAQRVYHVAFVCSNESCRDEIVVKEFDDDGVFEQPTCARCDMPMKEADGVTTCAEEECSNYQKRVQQSGSCEGNRNNKECKKPLTQVDADLVDAYAKSSKTVVDYTSDERKLNAAIEAANSFNTSHHQNKKGHTKGGAKSDMHSAADAQDRRIRESKIKVIEELNGEEKDIRPAIRKEAEKAIRRLENLGRTGGKG